ncbi:MAG: hypothetical protein QG599_3538 [Pseudomonadota bacterium]|nr:hypothetical protein [Pseudomonadota bacterium]
MALLNPCQQPYQDVVGIRIVVVDGFQFVGQRLRTQDPALLDLAVFRPLDNIRTSLSSR